eukprot:COSAG02_NODE_740_length_17807_cov_30.958987_6_plen_36_part_00
MGAVRPYGEEKNEGGGQAVTCVYVSVMFCELRFDV